MSVKVAFKRYQKLDNQTVSDRYNWGSHNLLVGNNSILLFVK